MEGKTHKLKQSESLISLDIPEYTKWNKVLKISIWTGSLNSAEFDPTLSWCVILWSVVDYSE